MGLDKKDRSDWIKALPFLLVLGVLVGTRVFLVVLVVCVAVLIGWMVMQAGKKTSLPRLQSGARRPPARPRQPRRTTVRSCR